MDLHPRQVALDVDAQVAALPGLQASFARVHLGVVDDDDRAAMLVEVDSARRRFQPLAVVRASALELTWVDDAGEPTSCRVSIELVPRAAQVHVRAARGALEIVATDGPAIDDVVVAKVFGRGATAVDWPASLRIAFVIGVDDLRALLDGAPAQELRALHVEGVRDLADLAPIARFERLTHLRLSGCPHVTDLGPLALAAPRTLKSLCLFELASVTDLTPIGAVATLTSLALVGLTSLRDLGPLSALESLRWLDVDGCLAVHDVAPLAGLRELELVSLTGCATLSDIASLASLPELAYLDLSGCSAIRHVAPLLGARALSALSLEGCSGIEDGTSLLRHDILVHLGVDDRELEAAFERSRAERDGATSV